MNSLFLMDIEIRCNMLRQTMMGSRISGRHARQLLSRVREIRWGELVPASWSGHFHANTTALSHEQLRTSTYPDHLTEGPNIPSEFRGPHLQRYVNCSA